jgi:hypothetical protein
VLPQRDRQIEIVFIGCSVGAAGVAQLWAECALTPSEERGGVEAWYRMQTPFPEWRSTMS